MENTETSLTIVFYNPLPHVANVGQEVAHSRQLNKKKVAVKYLTCAIFACYCYYRHQKPQFTRANAYVKAFPSATMSLMLTNRTKDSKPSEGDY